MPSNYRPISLCSIIVKLMERGIKDKLMDHLEDNGLLSDAQHGFRRNRSCMSNLLQYLNKVTEALDEGIPVDIVYYNYSKAFDKIPHQRLLMKLESYGIRGNVLNWIKDWLSCNVLQL